MELYCGSCLRKMKNEAAWVVMGVDIYSLQMSRPASGDCHFGKINFGWTAGAAHNMTNLPAPWRLRIVITNEEQVELNM